VENWGNFLKDDPFYHPYMTRMREDASFADPHEWNIDPKIIMGRTLKLKSIQSQTTLV